MSAVNITNVTVLDNPASFLTPFQFEISYDWKSFVFMVLMARGASGFLRVMNADGNLVKWIELLASIILSVMVDFFVADADPPDPSKIREEDIIGVTVLLLTCSYLSQEFVRVGYYVNNDYEDEQLREEPPPKVLIDKVQRNILSDKPRVTKFPINFHPEDSESREQPPPPDHPSDTDGNGEGPPASPDHHPSEEQGL
ncbi:Histone chaperone ASF1B [Morella rubra]|uniref:Histone chaperone ASF1B n=1 Tax=Morella rubra TaxID=262757 RepID=A0A6A1VEG2_9ROSI|nr:Histone chaperone ASF1B [Morella rubra]